MKLIDKNAIVAEFRRRIQESIDAGGATRGVYLSERMKEDSYILSFIDTLEVKEVDLEKELDTWRHNHFHGRRDIFANGEYLERISQLDIAKHFFELGLKAQKGE